MHELTKSSKIVIVVLIFSSTLFLNSITYSAIIIDHKCTDLAEVPENWIIHARDTYKVSYGHTSHGSQIVTGMQTLNDQMGCLCNGCEDNGCSDCTYGFCDDYYYYLNGSGNPEAPAGVLSLWDGRPDGAKDLGNPNRIAWEAATRLMLDDPRYDNRNLVMWSWCGQVSTATEDDITLYLTLMNQLEIDYPDVTFIYMTGHLDGTGEAGNLHMRNEQIRNYCITNDKILFDFADIESYDPDGEYFLDRGADDGCYYNGGNWADEWCAANSASDLCATCSCAHSRPLNCNLKGRAFWWMMARLAGWEADPTTSTTTTVDTMDTDGDGVLNSSDNCPNIPNPIQNDTYPPEGNNIGDACDCEGDFDFDMDCDGTDASLFKLHFGRSQHNNPCNTLDPCYGDFSCDGNVDGFDASLFKFDFGRSQFVNACPTGLPGAWCSY